MAIEASRETDEEPLWDGRYRLVRPLGVGGMGEVFLAEDRLLGDRAVALKRLAPAFTFEQRRFLAEHALLRRLAHPNIPRAYELGHVVEEGRLCPYFAMEVASGTPLHALVDGTERGLPLRAIVQVATGVLRALDHVHRHGVVHGDLKPGNLLVAERYEGLHIHLIDFGVSAALDAVPRAEVETTPEYASPEQLAGEGFDARADLYALGLVLFELIEHRRPWLESDPQALLASRTRDAVPQLSSPRCPPGLAALVRRLLAPLPEDRPRTAADALANLAAATGWDLELEPSDAFLLHLLSVPLPWREPLAAFADGVCRPEAPQRAVVIDVPPGYFARRLLGPVLDVAARSGARVVPLRFDERFAERTPMAIEPLLADRTRPLIVLLENIEAADAETLAALAASNHPDLRLVATRTRADAVLPPLLTGDDVRSERLTPWSPAELSGWIAAALGPVVLPLPLEPPTPAAVVEALGALHREGRLVRRGASYVYRPEGTGPHARPGAPMADAEQRIVAVEALLACVKAPAPERALAIYLGTWADVLPELVQRGTLVHRGNGTLEVADEARRAIAYGHLGRTRRAALHRRLAQALEESEASPHRVADEWLESGAPLLAVPHLVAAAELRPGRSWLRHSLALVSRARELVVAARAAHARDLADLELWRYEALVIRSEARVLLGCGELEAIDALTEELVGVGMEAGHRGTLRAALELRVELDHRRGDWDRLVGHALTLLALEGEPPSPEALAVLHWARGLRFRGEGLPTAALTELEAGLEALGPRQAHGPQLRLLAARAELALAVDWRSLAEAATATYLEAATRAGRADERARAQVLEAGRLRAIGRLDRALTLARAVADALPRQRTPRLDAEVELELGACHLELGAFAEAREHARFATTLAADDGDEAIVASARALEATAATYLGDDEAAWRAARRADRAIVLELALAERGFRDAEAILREATDSAWRAQRRLESTRAARAFRVAAEAALLRGLPRLAAEHADRAVAALRADPTPHVHAPRYLVTSARTALAAGDRARAAALAAEARALVVELAEAIADPSVRERWRSHPEQRAILAGDLHAPLAASPRPG